MIISVLNDAPNKSYVYYLIICTIYIYIYIYFVMDIYYNILTKKDKLSFLLLSRKIKLNKLKTQKKKKKVRTNKQKDTKMLSMVTFIKPKKKNQ
jgi:hypothetical protein